MKHAYSIFLLAFLLFWIPVKLQAQGIQYGSRVVLKGKVIDGKTQQPIPFANIGFIGKEIGTVSDDDGSYSLSFAPALLESTDRLQFSVIGYKKRILSKDESLLAVGKPLNITLSPEPYSLNEVVIGETKRKKSTIGDLNYDERIIGYWKDIEGLGGEILTKVKVRRKNTKLHNLKFKVLENGADSLLVRVNVYDTSQGLVGQTLLNESIQYTIKSKGGVVNIPLEKYGIYVHSNIVVGIELLKVYGRQIGFSLAGSQSTGISYVRYKSQGYYKPVEETSMAFKLDVSTPDKKGNSIEKRALPNYLMLYYDTSASTAYRDLEKELAIVERLLKETKEAQVDVVKFSLKAEEKKTFYLKKGKAEAIVAYLKDSEYNSLGDIEALPRPDVRENSAIILVTSGQTFLSQITPNFPAPIFAITTNPDGNKEQIEKLTVYSDGDILDGSKESIKELTKRFTRVIEEPPVKTVVYPTAFGKVSYTLGDSLVALQGARVMVQGSYTSTFTDFDGNYKIAVAPEGVLSVDFPGMKSKNVQIGMRGKTDVVLEPSSEMLDQIVVVGKSEDKNLTTTPSGIKNENAIGFKNKVITEDNIYARYTTLAQILRSESNIEVRFDPFTREEVFVFPRTFYASVLTPQPPIIVIDGIIYQQDGSAQIPQLDTQNIKSINISSSITATTQFGSIAAGGVIAIRTKSGNATAVINKEKPSALIKGNDYNELSVSDLSVLPRSDIQKRLAQTNSLDAAKEEYFTMLKVRTNPGLDFYMEVYKFFKNEDPQFAKASILSMVARAPENKQLLRTVGYALQDLGDTELSSRLYKKILKVAPNDIQSYRDLAKAQLANREYKNAFEGYKTILANSTEGLDFSPLQETAENELRRLIAFYKPKVSYQDLPNELLVGGFKKDQRLVFEWNDPAVQFELQFVNPQKKFFTWKHTIYENQEKITSDIKNGMMIVEFELDNLSEGEWLINLSHLIESKNSRETPYMRYTLYTDYGTSKEKAQTKIIPLNLLQEKTTIDKITNTPIKHEN